LLIDIIVIVLCGVITGCEGWKDIVEHAEDRKDWFSKFLTLEHGIPSHDTLERVFERLWPDEFQDLLMAVALALHETFEGKVISIDGKTLRGSFDTAIGQRNLHTVTAYVGECGVTLAQVATDVKSNEITAIPELLDLIDVQGAVVTLDAMGCQTKIVDKIVENGGDYIISLKGNQGTFHEAIKDYFGETSMEDLETLNLSSVLQTTDKGHGRIEERSYVIVGDIDWLPGRSKWRNLTTIGMVITRRTVGPKVSEERRYFIASIQPDVELFERGVRGHWHIENSSHYVLDVTFGEDHSRIRRDYAPENMATVRRLANGLLKNENNSKASIKTKTRRAMRRTDYLETLLRGLPLKQV
jgi:predicted transposase YbfD/YdcC